MKKQLFALFFSALILLSSVLGSGAVMVSAGRTTFAADTPATTGDIEEGDDTSSSDLSLREGDWEYVITGESVWIIGYYGTDPVIELPQTLGGKPVIGVENMALPQESDFVVPETITNLFFYSFSGKKLSIHAKEGSVAAAYANSHANIAYSEVHLFSDTVTAPTCTEQGYTTHTCPCGQVVVDSFVPPTGHLSVTDPALLPTCTKTGLTEGSHCAVCNEIITAQNVVPALGHAETVDPAAEPGCTTEGMTAGIHCERCHEVLVAQNPIPPKGHTPVSYEPIAAKCLVDGAIGGSYCVVCGTVLEEPIPVPATGHRIEVYIEAALPDCETPGCTEGKRCAVCNEILVPSQTIPAYGHVPVTIPGKAPSCTEGGLSAGSKCAVCGKILTEQTPLPPTGHTEFTIAGITPTCDQPGKTAGAYCGVCGTVTQEQILLPALGHTVVEDPAVKADCTNSGLTSGRHCSTCGTVFVAQTVLPALGHVTTVTVGKANTCEEDGYESGIVCVVCHAVLQEQNVIPATGHSYVTVPEKAPTYVSFGQTSYIECEYCHEHKTEPEQIPMLQYEGGEPVEDEGNSVAVETPGSDEVTLDIKRIENEDYKDNIAAAVTEFQQPQDNDFHQKDIEAVFNVTLCINGEEATLPEGQFATVTLSIGTENAAKLRDGILTLTHIHEGEIITIDPISIDVVNGTVTFRTDRFSPFCLIGHVYEDHPVLPTCSTKGYTLHVCTSCDQSYADAFTDELGHEFGAWSVYTNATDNEKGEMRRVCLHEGCTKYESRALQPLGHTYSDIVTEPTCTEYGYTTHVCKTCEDIYTDSFVQPTDHEFGEWSTYLEATETTAGLNVRKCLHCDACEYARTEIIGHTHTFTQKETVDPSCTENGYLLETCLCGETRQSITKYAKGHTLTSHEALAPTCEKTGHTAYVTCSLCDYTTYQPLDRTDHTPVSVPAVAAGCTAPGLTEGFLCAVCGKELVKQSIIMPTGHKEQILPAKEPGCLTTGLSEGVICVYCSETLSEQVVIPARGHLETTVPGIAATCQTPGLSDSTVCAVCHEVLTPAAVIPQAPHTPALLPAKEADCTHTGLTVGAECAVCGKIIIAQNTVPAKGHTFENGTCTVCGTRDTSVNPFTDVKKSAWYYSYVMDTYAKGLFEGFSDNTFHPDENMSRAQIVVVLHRLSGSPAPAAKSPFTDAKAAWYRDAVAWASENGVVTGFPGNLFKPDDNVTREMAAVIMFRYVNFCGKETPERTPLTSFNDSKTISSWAKDALSWAVGTGLITGFPGDLLKPKDSTPRCQFATILSRLSAMLEN